MKRAERYAALHRMAGAQRLYMLEQQSRLIDAQADTVRAQEAVAEAGAACAEAGAALDDLLGEGLFCPARFALLGGALLAAESVQKDSITLRDDCENSEAKARRTWQKRRDQADWIGREMHHLHKRIMRDDDDKRTAQAIALLAARRPQR